MKISKINIKNFRSIKNLLEVENISDTLVLTWENNSWKSSIMRAVWVFLKEKSPLQKDFYKWTNKIEINVCFSGITDDYLLKFVEFKKSKVQVKALKRDNVLFSWIEEKKIDKKEDLQTDEQVEFLANEWLETYKLNNDIVWWNVSIKLEINEDLKLNYLDKDKIEIIFPKVIYIDDERNFSDEQNWKSWTITEKIFKWIEIKDDSEEVDIDVLNQEIVNWTKCIKDLQINELECLLKSQINNKSDNIWLEITKNFSKFYDNWYEVKVIWDTDVTHKSFSLTTKIYDPNLDDDIDLDKVWAWLRALYLLSLLKAYNTFQRNENTIFMIEEPELYLHPWLQKRMAEILQDISKEQQLIFTTHSPLLLRKFDLENIKEIRKESNMSKKYDSDLNKILWKLWYSIFDIIDFDYIIFVEWTSDIEILDKIIEKHYPWLKVKVIDAWDCNSLSFFAHFKFLEISRDLNDKFILIRDWDNQNISLLKSNLETKLNWKVNDSYRDEIVNNKYKIIDRYSIENFFFIESILVQIKADFSKEDFITKAEEFLNTKERGKSSLKIKQPDIYDDFRVNLETDFDWNVKKVRWHNIMDCLLYYIYWDIDFFINKKVNYQTFISTYIEKSSKNDFWVLTQYLDELFWITT